MIVGDALDARSITSQIAVKVGDAAVPVGRAAGDARPAARAARAARTGSPAAAEGVRAGIPGRGAAGARVAGSEPEVQVAATGSQRDGEGERRRRD